jgi:hypothetical protein
VSRGDEEPEQAVRELLQTYEKQEAAVLKAELLEFLKSKECRDELEKTIQKPLETIVLSALTGAKFQEQLREAVIASLKPEIIKAAQTAAAGALNSIKVTIPEEAQKRMRTEAEETLRNAFATAQKESLGTVPRLANDARRQMQRQGEDSPPSGTAQEFAPRLSGDHLFWGAVVAVVLIVGAAIYWFSGRRDERPDPGYVDSSALVTESQPPTETVAPVTARPSALLRQYRAALMQMGPPDLPAPSDAQIACIESALPNAETAARLDVAALRALLNNCNAMSARPAGRVRIVAGVQAQLTEEARARTCSALQPVTIDGRHGTETSRALQTYVGCTDPIGVPEALETLGDYAAVGVYFIDKRMRDSGSTTQR